VGSVDLQRRTPGSLVVVSGGSLAGKSTLARALVERLGHDWVLVEADTAAPTLGSTDDFDPPRFARTLHLAAFTWLDAGYDVVLDGALPFPETGHFWECLERCLERRAFFVGVRTDPEGLATRAAARPGSDLGWARSGAAAANDNVPLDIEIDTSAESTAASVERIAGRLLVSRGS